MMSVRIMVRIGFPFASNQISRHLRCTGKPCSSSRQRVDEARVKREGNPLPQFSNNEGYTPPDLTKPFGYGSANNLPSNIYAGGK
ncbi:Uncharacterised protein [Klebsiella pneumoniae subsp. ozaenae]|uniref:Uncharacterized protein n=1 Tax=Klebsiella pneumoniae subsp. ozaenae TaxID=574 RepID=A0A378A6F9_KLEPO|nr:Uncharacterised protein [Klebsiella pneumoniae subsp. ozaenae]